MASKKCSMCFSNPNKIPIFYCIEHSLNKSCPKCYDGISNACIFCNFIGNDKCWLCKGYYIICPKCCNEFSNEYNCNMVFRTRTYSDDIKIDVDNSLTKNTESIFDLDFKTISNSLFKIINIINIFKCFANFWNNRK